MALVRCEVSDGPRAGFKAIGVPSIEGHREYLAIEERFLARRNGTYLLPVFVVGWDRQHGTALVQLPQEADSGTHRVWVRSADVTEEHADQCLQPAVHRLGENANDVRL
jgi:hypothetical protein